MKRFWIMLSAALGLAVAVPAFADIYTARIDASSTTITTAPMLVPGLTSLRSIKTILVKNRSAGEVAVNCSTSSARTPVALHNIYADTTEGWAIDAANLGNACFINSNTGSDLTLGIVVITVVGG